MKREEEIHNFIKDSGICDYKYDDLLDYNEYGGGDVICAFIEGVEWADEHPKNVWHDSSEYPAEVGAILYQTTLGQFRTVCNDKSSEGAWKVFAIDYDVSRWTYIKDLLPKGEEK